MASDLGMSAPEPIEIHIYWSPRWKRYDVTGSYNDLATGRRRVTTLKLENDLHPEIDQLGLRRLMLALVQEYETWLF